MSTPRLRATPLPGIGVQYDLMTTAPPVGGGAPRRRLHRSVYRADDPDSCAQSLRLTSGEAASLIDALKPSHHSPSLLYTTDLGLIAERIEIAATSRWNGRVLGETRMRTETGASVVAVLRRAEAIPRRRRTSGWRAGTPCSSSAPAKASTAPRRYSDGE